MAEREPVGIRAAGLGHLLRIVHAGSRFRVVCGCGFSTERKNSKKRAFSAARDHAVAVCLGKIPPMPLKAG